MVFGGVDYSWCLCVCVRKFGVRVGELGGLVCLLIVFFL